MSEQNEDEGRSVRVLSELTGRPRGDFEPPEDVDPESLDTVSLDADDERDPYGPGDELEL